MAIRTRRPHRVRALYAGRVVLDALRPRVRAAQVIGDDVTLYSVHFDAVLGATVRDRRKGAVEVWLDDESTLSFHTTSSEVESLCSYIERAAAS